MKKKIIPVISIIVPCYNGEKWLMAFLHSVENQTQADIQLILIDDGSTDRSAQLFKQWQRDCKREDLEALYLCIAHGGQAAAVSEGLKHVTAKYITWADADDVFVPDALKEKVEFLETHPDYGMVRNNGMIMDESLTVSKQPIYHPLLCREMPLFDGMFRLVYQSAGAGLYTIRSEILFDIYSDRTIPYSAEGQNLQLILPALSRTKCGFIDKILYLYRNHEDSHSQIKRGIIESLDRIEGFYALLLKLIPYCDRPPEILQAYAQEYRERERKKILAASAKKVRFAMQRKKEN